MGLPGVGCWSPQCRNMAAPSEDTLGTLKCLGCAMAQYCSVACQNAHRKAHKPACMTRARYDHIQADCPVVGVSTGVHTLPKQEPWLRNTACITSKLRMAPLRACLALLHCCLTADMAL